MKEKARVNILISVTARASAKELAALLEKKHGRHFSMLEAVEEAISLRLQDVRADMDSRSNLGVRSLRGTAD